MSASVLDLQINSSGALSGVKSLAGSLDNLGRIGESAAGTLSGDLSNAANRAAGAFQDASGRWRDASGKFLTGAEKAAMGINNIARASSATISRVNALSDSVSSCGMQIGKIGLALTPISVPLTAFAYKSVAAFNTQESAVASLSAAIENAGEKSAGAVKDFGDFATSIQNATIYGDEMVLQQMAMLRNFGVSTDQIKGATSAAVGLAARYQLDLGTAIDMVGKAAQGQTQTLARYGIILDENLSPQEKFNKLLSIGAGSFELAEKHAQTTEGRLQQLRNSLGDMMEPVGKLLVDSFRLGDAFDWMKNKVNGLATWIDNLSPAIKKIIAYIGLGIVVFSGIATAIGGAAIAIGAILSAVSAITLPIAAVVAVVVALGVVVVDNFSMIKDAITSAFGDCGVSIDDLIKNYLSPFGVIAKWLSTFIGKTIVVAIGLAKTAVDQLQITWNVMTAAVRGGAYLIIAALQKMMWPFIQVAKLIPGLKQYAAEFQLLGDEMKKSLVSGMKDNLSNIGSNLGDIGVNALNTARILSTDYTNAADKAADASKKLQEATGEAAAPKKVLNFSDYTEKDKMSFWNVADTVKSAATGASSAALSGVFAPDPNSFSGIQTMLATAVDAGMSEGLRRAQAAEKFEGLKKSVESFGQTGLLSQLSNASSMQKLWGNVGKSLDSANIGEDMKQKIFGGLKAQQDMILKSGGSPEKINELMRMLGEKAMMQVGELQTPETQQATFEKENRFGELALQGSAEAYKSMLAQLNMDQPQDKTEENTKKTAEYTERLLDSSKKIETSLASSRSGSSANIMSIPAAS